MNAEETKLIIKSSNHNHGITSARRRNKNWNGIEANNSVNFPIKFRALSISNTYTLNLCQNTKDE